MAENKIFFNQPIIPVGSPKTVPAPRTALPNSSFQEVFQKQISELKFSQHAQQRMKTRNIQLSSQDMQKLNTALDRAAQKGAKESLFVMNNLAFVVNIPNKTVITAVDGASMKENVFTNIDSAVFVE
jgi:flagellar operon protein